MRKDVLNSMAADAATSGSVREIAAFVVGRMAQRLGRIPTVPEVSAAILAVVPMLVAYHPDEHSDLDFYQPVSVTLMPHPGNPTSPITGRPKGRGDCEDMAVVLAAIAMAIPAAGGPAMSGVVEWMPQDGLPQNHVTSKFLAPDVVFANQPTHHARTTPSAWAWAETTIDGARVGEHPYAALDRIGAAQTSRITG